MYTKCKRERKLLRKEREQIFFITFARSIEERRLEAHILHVGEVLVDRDLHAETGVRINVW